MCLVIFDNFNLVRFPDLTVDSLWIFNLATKILLLKTMHKLSKWEYRHTTCSTSLQWCFPNSGHCSSSFI